MTIESCTNLADGFGGCSEFVSGTNGGGTVTVLFTGLGFAFLCFGPKQE